MRFHSTLLIALLPLPAAAQRAPVNRPTPQPAPRPERPPAPSSVTATITAAATGEITVQWTPVQGATSYQVGRHAPPAGWQRVQVVAGNVMSIVDRGRDLSTPHTYQVVAVRGDMASTPARSAPVQGDPVIVVDTAKAPTEFVHPSGRIMTATRSQSCESQGPDDMICTTESVIWRPPVEGGITLLPTCPAGWAARAGGWAGSFSSVTVTQSRPVGAREGWHVMLQGLGAPGSITKEWAQGYVACERRP